jgi:hypothetical protein
MFLDAKEGANEFIPVEFPECKGTWLLVPTHAWSLTFLEWTPIKVHPTVLKLVSKINTRVLIGNGLEKNKEWIEISATVSTSPSQTERYHHC